MFSPLKSNFVDELRGLVGGSNHMTFHSFESIVQFNAIMEDLIKTSCPAMPHQLRPVIAE
jgi:hypothetical protein